MGTFIAGIILAHLLSPNDYGAFTVALVALVVMANLNDLGLERTLVRWPGRVEDVGPTAVTLMFVFSLLLFAICVVGAAPFASAMGSPDATRLVQVIAFAIVINGIFAGPSAMLTRSFRQDRRTIADLTGFFVGTGLTVALAVLGLGAWSLVWGRLAGNAVVSLMHLILTPVRIRPGWDSAAARQLLLSGLPIAGAAVLAVAVLNVDYVIVGHELGVVALGIYTLAFNLASWPVTFIAVTVERVSVAAFGRLQGDRDKLQVGYNKAIVLLVAVTLPICLLIGILASPLINFVYGEKWIAAAAVLPFLAALGFLRVVFQLWSDLLVGVGASSRVFVTQIIWLGVLIIGISVAVRHGGLAAVGIAHVAVAAAVVLPVYLITLHGVARPVGEPARLVRLITAALLAGLVTALALLVPGPPLVQLLLGAVSCLVVYVLLLLPLHATIGVRVGGNLQRRYVGKHRKMLLQRQNSGDMVQVTGLRGGLVAARSEPSGSRN
jgi:PST family polysaccharide transporter